MYFNFVSLGFNYEHIFINVILCLYRYTFSYLFAKQKGNTISLQNSV